MGPVNLDAVHEYDELEERYRFLETQNNDLIAARREVLDVITRINSTTQKLFRRNFRASADQLQRDVRRNVRRRPRRPLASG